MLTLIIGSLISAANGAMSSSLLVIAQATLVDAPKSRKICHDVPVSNSRFTRRVCSTVVDKQPVEAQLAAAAPPVITTLGVGMSVVDSKGAEVGTITAVAADSVTVKTDKHEAQLPKSSLTISEGKALFGMSQTELDASIEKTLANTPQPELKVGATVNGKEGASVGTIDAVTAANVTIKLTSGLKISVPRSGIAAQTDGSGVIGLTAAELETQVKATQPAH